MQRFHAMPDKYLNTNTVDNDFTVDALVIEGCFTPIKVKTTIRYHLVLANRVQLSFFQ